MSAIPGGTSAQQLSNGELMLREAKKLSWTVGIWEGTRKDGADGSLAPMGMTVSPILGGRGFRQEIEIVVGNGLYRGFSVDVYDPRASLWVRQYINATNGSFVRIEGRARGEQMVWSSASAAPKRESRMVSERMGTDRWRRTMNISEDGGTTWRVLWQDELTRKK